MDGFRSPASSSSKSWFAGMRRDVPMSFAKRQHRQAKAKSMGETEKIMSKEVMIEQPEFTGRVNPSVHTRVTRYGLPCANCKIYYSAELITCPICNCTERVSPIVAMPRSVVRL